jgi:RNA polymerase sigma-70 factor (ECF subfamily)
MCEDLDAGFALLVKAHQSAVYSVALRVSGGHCDAEDLAAETFLRAYRVLRGYDVERIGALRPRAWLMTILLNLWRNAARDRGRRPHHVPLVDLPDVPSGTQSTEELAERGEGTRELAAMVATLPARQRAAVVLRHVVGDSVAEIAEALGCPDGTAKSHISRGLARLREIHPAHPAHEARGNGQPPARTLIAAEPVRSGGGQPCA